ncbi:shikimate kinase [Methanobacterium alcaliphilum]|uniref:shikimate kinase n=1 Tax=Methanobacterium alcaliphilum TaxID=392018 RepID=UPI002009E464|nr:shikimate kinase [Methanobacterium alcaliphilum]MCK9150863.1 shikimate kinase [Methanobacterium alcaliphilum]
MKKTVRAPGSATVINAISTGSGSAFGIQLYVTAEAKLKSSDIKCTSDRRVNPKLMNLCVEKVLNHFDLDIGIRIKTSSTLPVASGLSSSSATSNAVVMAVSKLISDEFHLEPMNDAEILNMAIDASLDAGVTITGAFDDASASYFGGLTVTNNLQREILKKDKMEKQNILIYMPDRKSLTAQSDVNRMKLLSPWVNMAFQEALHGDIYKALTLNGILYCAALGFNSQIALDALDSGAIASGLSGTGPSFVAVVDDKSQDKVQEAWNAYSGKVISTEVDNKGTMVV